MTMLSGLIGAGGKMKTQEFLSGTFTWVKPPSVESIYIFAVAGGGGGAKLYGGGGGAGAIIEGWFPVTDDVTITVGEGGACAPQNHINGYNGGDTIFTGGLELTVPGGGGGGGDAENGSDGGCGGGPGNSSEYPSGSRGGGGGGMGGFSYFTHKEWIGSYPSTIGNKPGKGSHGSGGSLHMMGAPGYKGFAAGGNGCYSSWTNYYQRENSGSGGNHHSDGRSGYVKIMWFE